MARPRSSMYSTSLRLAALGLMLATPSLAQKHKGYGRMWTFENPPLGYLKAEYGFDANGQWLDNLRLASLRFGDWCSASFVSPKGLIMTNHHCVRDNIAAVSPPGADWVKNGFYADSMEAEPRLYNSPAKEEPLSVQQLVSMRDVTAQIDAGITAEDDDSAIAKKREANEKALMEKMKAEQPGLTPQVVKLHQGARFMLYSYKVWDDVRLVCAPHLQSAHFGGDPDNFTYPRFAMDFAFCRAYEDGKPAETQKHYFKWSKAGAKPDELVFVTGNPGSTGRLLTMAQMEYLRDAEYPLTLDFVDTQLEILRKWTKRAPQLEEALRTNILSFENSQKAVRGYLGGLQDETLMAEKRAAEKKFQAAVAADPELQQKFGSAWTRLSDINRKKTALEPRHKLQTPSYSGELSRAMAILDAVYAEDDKEREEAIKEAKGRMRANPLFTDLFANHLMLARKWLGKDDPYVKAIFGDGDLRDAVMRLQRSNVKRNDVVEKLIEGGAAAVEASDDAAIVAARVIRELQTKNDAQAEALKAQEDTQSALIGRAIFAVYGEDVSPDATMTLRFADGVVRGYEYNGTLAPPTTTFYGLYGRNLNFSNEYPFDLPAAWLDRRDQLDLSTPVNFASTNDIIGGNSGSPVVNQNLEVVGLIFDGNIEQLPNRFLFRDSVERSVSVHSRAVLEALTKIYDATRVVEELTGR